MAVGQASAASLVPSCIPHALDQALAVAGVAVLVRSFLSSVVVLGGGNFEGFDPAARQTNGKERLGRVKCLREQVRRQRESAEVFHHIL